MEVQEEINFNATDFPRELIEQEAARRRLRRAEILKREADEEHDAAIQEWHRASGAVQEWQSVHRPEIEKDRTEVIGKHGNPLGQWGGDLINPVQGSLS